MVGGSIRMRLMAWIRVEIGVSVGFGVDLGLVARVYG